MTTRIKLIELAAQLIKAKGYNGFSFYDLAQAIGVKTSSIHYHFPSKTDLGIAVIEDQISKLKALKTTTHQLNSLEKINSFFSIYENIHNEENVCLVGSLATDFKTIDEKLQKKLKKFTDLMLEWVVAILEEGQQTGEFDFNCSARDKAVQIISCMLAVVQLCRLTSSHDFTMMKTMILNDIKRN